MVKKILVLNVVASLATVVACRSDLFLGRVEGVAGKAIAPNGRTPFYGAKVVVEELKQPGYYAESVTDVAGVFAFPAVPDGKYRVTVTSVNGVFKTLYFVEVVDGHSPEGVEVILPPARARSFYVVPGKYDDIGAVWADLGYLYKTLDVSALAVTPNPLADADVVSINSGADTSWADNAVVRSNLRSFVAAGGHLLVSDRAWPFIAKTWPGKIEWGSSPEVGSSQELAATFADTDLAKYMTVPTWRLYYDLPGWALPEAGGGPVFVTGDVATAGGPRDDAPLLLGFPAGDGFVTFATFTWRRQLAAGRLPARVALYLLANR